MIYPRVRECENILSYITIIRDYASSPWFYRGQSNGDYELIPKGGRRPFMHSSGKIGFHEYRFDAWKESMIAHIANHPAEDLAILALAQHYGLATKFLDWTYNPLVALFFAVDDEDESVDGAVFVYLNERPNLPHNTPLNSITEVSRYVPRPFDKRIVTQKAVFTYHPDPTIPLEPKEVKTTYETFKCNLVKIKIPSHTKLQFKFELDNFGINAEFIFPGLEGLASFLNSKTKFPN